MIFKMWLHAHDSTLSFALLPIIHRDTSSLRVEQWMVAHNILRSFYCSQLRLTWCSRWVSIWLRGGYGLRLVGRESGGGFRGGRIIWGRGIRVFIRGSRDVSWIFSRADKALGNLTETAALCPVIIPCFHFILSQLLNPSSALCPPSRIYNSPWSPKRYSHSTSLPPPPHLLCYKLPWVLSPKAHYTA